MARPRSVSPDKILTAAEKVFAQQGYGETSLRQLIAAASISTTAFYARFKSKEALLIALVSRVMGELFEAGREALAHVDGVEQGIERGGDALVATLLPHRTVVALALTEGAAIPAVRDALSNAYAMLAKLLAAHIAVLPAQIDCEDPQARAWTLVGALQFQICRWAVFGQLDDEELPEAVAGSARSLLALPGSASSKGGAK
jgi:AcrR family transcriptional regulator